MTNNIDEVMKEFDERYDGIPLTAEVLSGFKTFLKSQLTRYGKKEYERGEVAGMKKIGNFIMNLGLKITTSDKKDLKSLNSPESSNGRTGGFGPPNEGSIPSSGSINKQEK